MKTFYRVASEFEILPGKGLKIRIKGKNIVILRYRDTFLAFQNECPHQYADLSDGYIKEEKLYCALHHWSFELPGGAYSFNPELKLRSFAIKVENQQIFVGI
ncbi:MAG: Rieske (2Fe-2S) protein [Calditrichales bacterium]|nr:MAG: Rieske (2Fe-2S) protein [Calditrichales bacterium]